MMRGRMVLAFIDQMPWSRWEVLLRAAAVAKQSTDRKIWMRRSVGSPVMAVADPTVDDGHERGDGGHLNDIIASNSSGFCIPRDIMLEVVDYGVGCRRLDWNVVGREVEETSNRYFVL